MNKWVVFYTNDGAGGCDDSEWGLFDTRESAAHLLDQWRETLKLDGYRVGVELVKCPDKWLQIQLEDNYDGTTEEDEYFFPIPNWGA